MHSVKLMLGGDAVMCQALN